MRLGLTMVWKTGGENMRGKALYGIVAICFLICACAKPNPKYAMSVSSPLTDNGTISLSIDIEFASIEELNLFAEKAGKVKHALRLMFSGYASKDLVNKGLVNNTIKNMITREFNIPFKKVTITGFELKDKNKEKVVQETVFTPQK